MLQGSEDVVVVYDGIKLGCEEGAKLVSSYSSSEGDIYENLQGEGTVSGIHMS